MAVVTSTLVALSVGLSAASFVAGEMARSDARSAQNKARGEQEKIQGEQRAQNAAQAAQERRNQVREERVRRSRILQSAEGTGVSDSSGEFGALGSLGTQLSANVGGNLGKLASSERTGVYAQNAANFMGEAQNAMFNAQQADKLFNLSTSIFSAAGGFGPTPTGATGMTEATRTGRLPGTM